MPRHHVSAATPLLLLLLAACGEGAVTQLLDAGASDPVDAGTVDAGFEADAGPEADAGFELDAGFEDAGVVSPTFAVDVAPILQLQCQGCHFVTDNPPQILIDGQQTRLTYDRLVAQPAARAPLDYIAPGAPEDSYLLHKVEGTQATVGGQGNHMPPPVSRRRLSADEVAILRAWITAGAPFE